MSLPSLPCPPSEKRSSSGHRGGGSEGRPRAGIGREDKKRLRLKDRFSSRALKPIQGGAKAELSQPLTSQPTFNPSQLESISKRSVMSFNSATEQLAAAKALAKTPEGEVIEGLRWK